jgi:hypothetical protein
MVDLGGPAGNISSVLRKVLITAFTGGVAYAITTVAQQDPTWSVTLSVLIGGVALVRSNPTCRRWYTNWRRAS